MLEIFFVALVFLPYTALGKVFKTAKDYCKKKDWIFLEEVLNVVGFPFSAHKDVY